VWNAALVGDAREPFCLLSIIEGVCHRESPADAIVSQLAYFLCEMLEAGTCATLTLREAAVKHMAAQIRTRLLGCSGPSLDISWCRISSGQRTPGRVAYWPGIFAS
jgi:hypothetical protein